jgi:uncharacterized membrane protein (UPF0127 family)
MKHPLGSSFAAFVVVSALAGCTKSEPVQVTSSTGNGPVAPTPPPPTTPAQPTPAPATPPAPPPRPADSTGPSGPATRATPGTEDGRNQLDLLQPRPIVVGAVPVQAWVADTTDRRQLGLMNVRELPKDHGMVFVYPRARRMAFWMHNTLIPLSIAYISDDGTIAQIEDMQAMDESTHPSRSVVRFALEMPLGWYTEHGIHPGDHIDGIVQLEGYGE